LAIHRARAASGYVIEIRWPHASQACILPQAAARRFYFFLKLMVLALIRF